MLLFLLACSLPDDAPACTNEPMHTCGDVQFLQTCTDMGILAGLKVNFSGAAAETYDAVVTMDGVEVAFSCSPNGGVDPSFRLMGCDAHGFTVEGHGDEVTVAVRVDGVETEQSFEPCWDASEPNGTCCGWAYSSEVTFDLG